MSLRARLAAIAAIAAVAAVAACGEEPPAPPADPPPPPVEPLEEDPLAPGPRRPVAGLIGLRTVSELVYPSAPEHPQRLTATFAFPGRARLEYAAATGTARDRRLDLRCGGRLWQQVPGEPAPEPLAGEARASLLRQLALRRALLLYPDGVDWVADGDRRRAPVRDGEDAVGELVAEQGADGRPAHLAVVDAAGLEQERLVVREWRDDLPRALPARLALEVGGAVVYEERVEEVALDVLYIDAFFLPLGSPERGERLTARADDRAHEVVRPPRVESRLEVRAGSLAALLAGVPDRRARAAEALAPLGLALAPETLVEVDDAGRPAALRLRVAGELAGEPPPGFARVAGGPGLALTLPAAAALTAGHVASLAGALPPGARPGAAYLRLEAPDLDAPAQLVVPFEP